MSLSRRRFLTITASFAALPSMVRAQRWTDRAFGADIAIELRGPATETASALAKAKALIKRLEHRFTLYDPSSELMRLNRVGRLAPSHDFFELMRIADEAHRRTKGLFDPSVQPLWQALHRDGDTKTAEKLIGWERVEVSKRMIRIEPGQALTLNGIAQGFATDRVSELMRSQGFSRTLVNIGEHRGTGVPWRIGIEDPTHGLMGAHTIENAAMATSSPLATGLHPDGHIVHPSQTPHWSTVTVEADSAAMADALSTGLSLADIELVREVLNSPGVNRITLVDHGGDLMSL